MVNNITPVKLAFCRQSLPVKPVQPALERGESKNYAPLFYKDYNVKINKSPSFKGRGISYISPKDIKEFSGRGFSILDKLKKITMEEYDSLLPGEKNILRELGDKFLYDMHVELNQELSTIVKKHYDGLYGPQNYAYVVFGRSLATVAKTLELKGIPSYALPISGLCRKDIDQSRLFNANDRQLLAGFFKARGIGADEIKKSSKHIVFSDYSCSGSTINHMEQVLSSPEFGFNSAKCHFDSINEVLEASVDEDKMFMFFDSLYDQWLKRYSHIEAQPYNKIVSFESSFMNSASVKYPDIADDILKKLFWFDVMDKESKFRGIKLSQKLSNEFLPD